MLRYAASALGILVLLLAVVRAVGFTLPVKHRASRRSFITARPDVVYALLANVEGYPSWRSDVTRVERSDAPAATVKSGRMALSPTLKMHISTTAFPPDKLPLHVQ